MGALAHYIENEGIPTAGISLVWDNTARIKPPRFLWVPFEFGRPFGAPNAPDFQTKVLQTTLALLERDDGPVILDEFSEDPPTVSEEELYGWTCPISLPSKSAKKELGINEIVLEEIRRLQPWWELAKRNRGRTSVGLSNGTMQDNLDFLQSVADGSPSRNEALGSLQPAQLLKATSEDLKSFYMEAATAQPEPPHSSVLADWFWGETAAGQFLLDLHPVCLKSHNPGIKVLARNMLVPREQMHRLNILSSYLNT